MDVAEQIYHQLIDYEVEVNKLRRDNAALLEALQGLDSWLATEISAGMLSRTDERKRVALLRNARAAIRQAEEA